MKSKTKVLIFFTTALATFILAIGFLILYFLVGYMNTKVPKVVPESEEYSDTQEKTPCVRAGCSNTLCVEKGHEPAFTTCEWFTEYACFDLAKCEQQNDGTCGWTETNEYRDCKKDL